MIRTKQDLSKIIDQARSSDAVALDTEFIWEKTFYPRLGVIQIALSDEKCYLIDPIAISDLSSLGTLLADKNVTKILHDAPQDLTILSRVTNALPHNIFDTRIAAGFAGLSATISLASLITELLDIDLAKTQTRTNWLHRPLTQEQKKYAMDDVRYLRAARLLLLTRIISPKIRSWLKEELGMFNAPSFSSPPDDYVRYKKIRGSGHLDRVHLSELRELAAWRERKAKERDRPRGHILSDKALLAIVHQEFSSADELHQHGLINAKKATLFGNEIIEAIQTGRAVKEADLPSPVEHIRLNTKEKQAYKQLIDFIKRKSNAQGIDPQLIATSSELKRLIKHNHAPDTPLPPRLAGGWRRRFLEECFTDIHQPA